MCLSYNDQFPSILFNLHQQRHSFVQLVGHDTFIIIVTLSQMSRQEDEYVHLRGYNRIFIFKCIYIYILHDTRIFIKRMVGEEIKDTRACIRVQCLRAYRFHACLRTDSEAEAQLPCLYMYNIIHTYTCMPIDLFSIMHNIRGSLRSGKAVPESRAPEALLKPHKVRMFLLFAREIIIWSSCYRAIDFLHIDDLDQLRQSLPNHNTNNVGCNYIQYLSVYIQDYRIKILKRVQ